MESKLKNVDQLEQKTPKSPELDRRGFLGVLGAMGMGMGAMGLGMTGCAPQTKASAETATVVREGLPAEPGLDGIPGIADMETQYTDAQLDAMILDQTMATEDYVTPGGKTIPAVYINLRNRLNRIGAGMGSDVEDSETAWDFPMLLFSEDDAAHLLEMPMYKVFSAVDYAMASGRPVDECAEILADMGDRGLIQMRWREGVNYYELMTMEPGIWERNIQRIDSAEYVNAHHGSVGTDMNVGFNETPTPQLMVLPCSPDVVEGEMLPYTSWEDAIRLQKTIAVIPCACRRAADTLGTRDPDCAERFGTETCIFMGEPGRFMIDHGYGRQLTADECVEFVKENVDKGLVPEIIWTKTQEIMCQCCLCDCGVMGAYHAYGCEGEVMQYCSNYLLKYDKDACTKCGKCIERCPMGAISWGDDGFCEMDHQCIRCGQCAYICPQEARKLVGKPADQVVEPPDDWHTKELGKARRRMVQGLIHDFTGK